MPRRNRQRSNTMKKTRSAAILLAAAMMCGCGSLDGEKVVPQTGIIPVGSTDPDSGKYIYTEYDEDSEYVPEVTVPEDDYDEYTTSTATSAATSAASEMTAAQKSDVTSEKTEETTTAAPETESTSSETSAPPAATTSAAPETTTTTAVMTPAPETTTATTTAAVSPDDEKYEVIGDNGMLVIKRDGHYMGLMACWGTYGLCDNYVASAKSFANALPDTDFYSMVIPTSVEYYLPDSQSGFTASQKNKIDYIAENLPSNVTDVPVYDALGRHADECIFARTDHHWLPLGAYYAAEQFASAADFDFPPLSQYKAVTLGGYVGSMYSYSKDKHLYNDPEDFTMYISPNDADLETTYYNGYFGNGSAGDLFVARNASAYYCSFLGGDNVIAEIETGVKNGRTLVVFKESYGNALIPFLTSGFEKIYVCDIRYFYINAVDFCKNVGATDVLFATCTFTPAGGNGKYFGYIQQY